MLGNKIRGKNAPKLCATLEGNVIYKFAKIKKRWMYLVCTLEAPDGSSTGAEELKHQKILDFLQTTQEKKR